MRRRERADVIFEDRAAAGLLLATELEHLKGRKPIILALPRGGVPVGAAVAEALGAPLDVVIVRKLGVPFQPELGMGAIGEEGVRELNADIVRLAHVSEAELDAVERRERRELDRRVELYRGDRPMKPLAGRTVVVVDDGIATGGTMRAALSVVRAHGAEYIVLAVPVAARDSLAELAPLADDVVCLVQPKDMVAIGYWYRDFSQTTDAEVMSLLASARAREVADEPGYPPGERCVSTEVAIPIDGNTLEGHLSIPADAVAIVIFAHGSGSSRHSPRNRTVASSLNDAGLGTLLFDLLTREEEVHRSNVFDVGLLGQRLSDVTTWIGAQPFAAGKQICYFGASTGAAAALWAAAQQGAAVGAVVSRGGRPDLARDRLAAVQSPVLLIVGERDHAVAQLNRDAARLLRCENRVEIIPGATHLFEEAGALEVVARLAAAWFRDHTATERSSGVK